MSRIDRQRIAAVRLLESHGYTFDTEWTLPGGAELPFSAETDRMHRLLVARADTLTGAPEGSPEADELEEITTAIESYEFKRWPSGKIARGKG